MKGQTKKLQIMWNVPYNQDHYLNCFAIGYGNSAASKKIFDKMYNKELCPENFSRAISNNKEKA